MGIRLTNTLSGRKEDFKPLRKGEVGIYLCGPTVYDEPHIGHVRSAYVFDVIRKYFSFRGYKVRFVRNVTDVDDKIIQKAKEISSGDLLTASREVAERFYNAYSFWMNRMGIKPPDIEPWATDHIPEMQTLIEKLIRKKYAYISGGNVYYSVRKFKDYGKLSRRPLDEMKSGVRVEPGEGKKDPLDFALWKRAKPQEPSWKSPWGEGRPGWHIECSVMSMLYLGETFDIHCGGQDLIFPHHENEIAQSEAATGTPFAHYWLHNGMLTIEGEKMSKSLGNYVTVEKILEKFSSDVLKIFFLSVHYRNPIDFSWKKLEDISQAKEKFNSFLAKVNQIRKVGKEIAGVNSKDKTYMSYCKELNILRDKFIQAMDDDFNTALALGALYELLNLGNIIFEEDRLLFNYKAILLSEVKNQILELGEIFSLFNKDLSSYGDLNLFLSAIIKIRESLRKERQFDLADRIRNELTAVGIILEDGKVQTSWRWSKK